MKFLSSKTLFGENSTLDLEYVSLHEGGLKAHRKRSFPYQRHQKIYVRPEVFVVSWKKAPLISRSRVLPRLGSLCLVLLSCALTNTHEKFKCGVL